EPGDLRRTAGPLEESPSRHQAHLVAGADTQHAGDQLLEEAPVALLGQGEHRRLGPWPHRAADAGERGTDLEWALAPQRIDPAVRRSTPTYAAGGEVRRSCRGPLAVAGRPVSELGASRCAPWSTPTPRRPTSSPPSHAVTTARITP